MNRRLMISECNSKRKVLLFLGYLLYLFTVFLTQRQLFSTKELLIGPLEMNGHLFFDFMIQFQILLLVGFILLGGYKTFLISTVLNLVGFGTCLIMAVKNQSTSILPEILSYVTTAIVIALIYNYKSRVKMQFAELEAKERALQKMAYFDGLTNILNRKIFIELVQDRIVQYAENRDDFYIIFLDVDDFKHVNDKMGHYYGDLLLKELAYRIMRHLSERDAIGRLGGDELGLLIYAQSENLILEILRKIKEEILRVYRFEGKEVQATVSMGAAHFPLDGDTTTELLKNADIAMYQSKAAGKNKITLYKRATGEFLEETLEE